jgi:hypothetical protein
METDPEQKREANFSSLLVGLLLILIGWPAAQEIFGEVEGLYVQIAFTGLLIVGLWSLHKSRRLFIAGIILATASAITAIVNALIPGDLLVLATMAILVTFCAMSLWIALRQVLLTDDIDWNRLVGAICAYLLLGFMFGLIHILIAWLLPGSYTGIGSPETDGEGVKYIYYSFVTLTTLGYGDITPVRPLAGAVAYIEAVFGVFYIAILVGTLIGLMLSRAPKKN